jgi:small conductance mechanosensitive channel
MEGVREYITTEIINLEVIIREIVEFFPRLATGIVVLLVFWGLYRVTAAGLRVVLGRTGLEPFLVNMLVNKIYRIFMVMFAVVMAASQVGLNVSAALAGLGVMGLAIGFAAQDILSSIIAGFTIFMDRPFSVGDYITAGEQYGRVTNITLRSTRIRTPRNTYVVIPNKGIVDSVLVNHSKHGDTRVDVTVGIAYKESISHARQVLLDAVAGIDGVLEKPAPTVVASELGDSSVNLVVRVWMRDAERERDIRWQVVECSKVSLDAAGIEIPFPHLQVFWDDVDDRVMKKVAAVAGGSGGGSSLA